MSEPPELGDSGSLVGKRNKESLGALSAGSGAGVCVTGPLLMADFSRAQPQPLHLRSPPPDGDKDDKQRTLLLALLRLISLKGAGIH